VTPVKCARHELRKGELADGWRYSQALIESRRCWRCRALAIYANLTFWVSSRLRGKA
jgi:hypothetical protein